MECLLICWQLALHRTEFTHVFEVSSIWNTFSRLNYNTNRIYLYIIILESRVWKITLLNIYFLKNGIIQLYLIRLKIRKTIFDNCIIETIFLNVTFETFSVHCSSVLKNWISSIPKTWKFLHFWVSFHFPILENIKLHLKDFKTT